MPAQSRPARHGLKGKSPRAALPEPGIGGYDYPRGPYGATGFPGSTPASRRVHPQTRDGRKDPSHRGVPEFTISELQEQWEQLPARTPGTGAPSYVGGAAGVIIDSDQTARRPKRPTGILGFFLAARQVQPPARLKPHTTGPERREIPHIGGAPGSENVRNDIAQRYKARPEIVRAYRASPNPGKTGAQLDAPSRYHPGTMVHGHPDGKPVPGMAPQTGYPPTVTVQSRFVETEGGSQEGYAMNRPMLFTKGGTPPDIPHGAAPHIRGARMSGLRYFGALADQQKIGLDSDAFGIVRKRGPRHRPVRFEQPTPHAANFYDLPSIPGDEAPDMIHRSPNWGTGRARADAADRRGEGSRQTGRRPRRG